MATWPQHGQELAWPHLQARKISISASRLQSAAALVNLLGRPRAEGPTMAPQQSDPWFASFYGSRVLAVIAEDG